MTNETWTCCGTLPCAWVECGFECDCACGCDERYVEAGCACAAVGGETVGVGGFVPATTCGSDCDSCFGSSCSCFGTLAGSGRARDCESDFSSSDCRYGSAVGRFDCVDDCCCGSCYGCDSVDAFCR